MTGTLGMAARGFPPVTSRLSLTLAQVTRPSSHCSHSQYTHVHRLTLALTYNHTHPSHSHTHTPTHPATRLHRCVHTHCPTPTLTHAHMYTPVSHSPPRTILHTALLPAPARARAVGLSDAVRGRGEGSLHLSAANNSQVNPIPPFWASFQTVWK